MSALFRGFPVFNSSILRKVVFYPHFALQNVLSIFSIKIPNNVQVILTTPYRNSELEKIDIAFVLQPLFQKRYQIP
jgi:hypothetical protein